MKSRRKQKYILGLDIGGTKLAGAVFDSKLNLVGQSRILTRAEGGPDAVFGRLARMADTLMKRSGIGPGDIRSIGVGCGGPLDSDSGIIYSPPNLPGWDAFPLKQKLETQFGIPAFVDNDANAAAMAEHRFGAGRGYRNIFYITASTGIGSGLIMEGGIYRGANCSAGEFGHIVLARNGPKCNCGGRGCLEALASGTAIARRARRDAARSPNSLLAKVLADEGRITARDVTAAARRKDELATKIFMDAAFYLGLGVTSAIHLVNPEIVIIGGGLTRAGRLLFDPLRQTVTQRAQHHLANFVKIAPAQLGSRVGIYGALSVALERRSSLQ